jgi:hypothetical protein
LGVVGVVFVVAAVVLGYRAGRARHSAGVAQPGSESKSDAV